MNRLTTQDSVRILTVLAEGMGVNAAVLTEIRTEHDGTGYRVTPPQPEAHELRGPDQGCVCNPPEVKEIQRTRASTMVRRIAAARSLSRAGRRESER